MEKIQLHIRQVPEAPANFLQFYEPFFQACNGLGFRYHFHLGYRGKLRRRREARLWPTVYIS